jgi:hypothetical protein
MERVSHAGPWERLSLTGPWERLSHTGPWETLSHAYLSELYTFYNPAAGCSKCDKNTRYPAL